MKTHILDERALYSMKQWVKIMFCLFVCFKEGAERVEGEVDTEKRGDGQNKTIQNVQPLLGKVWDAAHLSISPSPCFSYDYFQDKSSARTLNWTREGRGGPWSHGRKTPLIHSHSEVHVWPAGAGCRIG